MLEEVGKNARRAADLVQQILAFAGKGRFVIQSVDLSSLVREMMGLLNSSVSGNTKLEYELTLASSTVDADATQLRQVVMNLVINASEAIADKPGTVTIRTGIYRPNAGHRIFRIQSQIFRRAQLFFSRSRIRAAGWLQT